MVDFCFSGGNTVVPGLEIEQTFNGKEPVYGKLLGGNADLGPGKSIVYNRISAKKPE